MIARHIQTICPGDRATRATWALMRPLVEAPLCDVGAALKGGPK